MIQSHSEYEYWEYLGVTVHIPNNQVNCLSSTRNVVWIIAEKCNNNIDQFNRNVGHLTANEGCPNRFLHRKSPSEWVLIIMIAVKCNWIRLYKRDFIKWNVCLGSFLLCFRTKFVHFQYEKTLSHIIISKRDQYTIAIQMVCFKFEFVVKHKKNVKVYLSAFDVESIRGQWI